MTILRSISFPRGEERGYLILLMQNEESVFCRALEPNFVTHRASVRASICVADSAAQWSCSSEGEVLWAVGPGQSTVVAGVVQGISLTISVPSPIGRHHKMRGEH